MYLSVFLLLGLVNQNHLYYTIYDFVRMISSAGFFFYGFYYFKDRGLEKFIELLRYSSTLTVILFVILYCIVWYLKFDGYNIYAQVNIDLVFLVMLSLYERKYMLWAIIFSFLSLKRMSLIATMSTVILALGKHKLLHLLLAAIFFPAVYILALKFGLIDKYLLTIETISENFFSLQSNNITSYVNFLYLLDEVRGIEVEKVVDTIDQAALFFGHGMGGGVIERYYVTDEVVQVSFAHFSYVSLIAKMGIVGLAIPLVSFLFILGKVGGTLNILLIFIFGLVSSIFAAYIVSSWAFWLCLGGGLGACYGKKYKLQTN